MRWSNLPARREDGVWCPTIDGVIEDGPDDRVVVQIRGLSILEEGPGVRRGIVAAVWFHAEVERFRWLNYVLGVGEGEIDEAAETWSLRVAEIRNEAATRPPAIR